MIEKKLAWGRGDKLTTDDELRAYEIIIKVQNINKKYELFFEWGKVWETVIDDQRKWKRKSSTKIIIETRGHVKSKSLWFTWGALAAPGRQSH